MNRRVFLGLAASGIALMPVGCARAPKLVKVTGRVQYADGKPVTAASIVFTPEGTGTGQTPVPLPEGGEVVDGPLGATGMLNTDGSFVLRTYPYGDGAKVGKYRVTVSLGHGAKTPALARYTKLSNTPLVQEVPPEGLTDLVITLK